MPVMQEISKTFFTQVSQKYTLALDDKFQGLSRPVDILFGCQIFSAILESSKEIDEARRQSKYPYVLAPSCPFLKNSLAKWGENIST